MIIIVVMIILLILIMIIVIIAKVKLVGSLALTARNNPIQMRSNSGQTTYIQNYSWITGTSQLLLGLLDYCFRARAHCILSLVLANYDI